jgi:hypothetical protein
MNDSLEKIESTLPSGRAAWLHDIPDDKRCAAMSKRTRQRCNCWAIPGRRVCRFHGGLSCGPKNPSIKHGYASLDSLKERMTMRLNEAFIEEGRTYRIDCLFGWIRARINELSYPEFRKLHSLLSDYCHGNLSIQKLIGAINPERKKKGKENV